MTPKEALDKVIEQVGGQAPFAVLLGKKTGHVYYWLKSGQLPAEHCPAAEGASRDAVARDESIGPVVTCEQLNPDVRWGVLRERGGPVSAEAGEAKTAVVG